MAILFATILIDLIGFGILIPIMPFMVPEFNGSKMDVAMIIVVYSICGGLVGPLWGKLSDKIGRKPVLLICLAGAALSYVALAFATSLLAIYIARIFAGLMAGNFGVASAYVADITKPEERAKGMGMIGAAFGLGMVLGPAIGGLASGDEGNYTLAFMVAGGLSVTAFLAGLFFLPESLTKETRAEHKEQQKGQAKLSLPAMVKSTGNTGLVIQYLFHNTCISSVSYLFPLWMGDYLGWGAKEVGTVFAIQGLAMAALQGKFIGPLAARVGDLRLLGFGVLLMMSGFLVATVASQQAVMITSFFMAITGATFCTPLLNTLVTKRTPPPMRGRMMGTTSAISSWGRVAGPLLAGVVLSAFGYAAAWLIGVLFAAFLFTWVVSEARKPPVEAV